MSQTHARPTPSSTRHALPALARRRVLASAFIAGSLSTLALAPLGWWPVMVITMSGLVMLLDRAAEPATTVFRRARRFALIGWWFGFGYFLIGLYWTGFAFFADAARFAWMAPFGVLLLPAGLALFHALAAGLASLLWKRGPGRILLLAIAFFCAEWLRGHVLTGFPWNALGYTLTADEALMQAASIFGIHGLTLIAVFVFAAPATLADRSLPASMRAMLPAVALAMLISGLVWGHHRLSWPAPDDVAGVRLRIVQADIAQADKWKPELRDAIFARYLELSRGEGAGAPGEDGITHVIWPESALPFLYYLDTEIRDEAARSAFAGLLGPTTTLILGAERALSEPGENGRRLISAVFNSVLVLAPDGSVVDHYDKAHLVPFGEYLPFQTTLEAIGIRQLTNLPGGFSAGRGFRAMRAPGLPPFQPLVCYEIIFPGALSLPSRPAWLLNLTDDGWFGNSAGPHQHLHQARVRAVERGLPVVRAANTGISAIIDAYGRVRASLTLGTSGHLDTPLPGALGSTIFGTQGHVVMLTTLIVAVFSCVFLLLNMHSHMNNSRAN